MTDRITELQHRITDLYEESDRVRKELLAMQEAIAEFAKLVEALKTETEHE